MPEIVTPRPRWPATDGIVRGGWPVYLLGLFGLTVGSAAAASAIHWYGRPFAGALVGPDAVVSGVTSPDWDGPRQGLRHPDEIVAIEGIRLDTVPHSQRGAYVSSAVERAVGTGATQLSVDVLQGNTERHLSLAVQRLDGATWWLLAGSLFFAGALFLMAGLVALWVCPHGALSRTFAVLAAAAALFMFTLFDYHTAYRLVPFFLIGFALLPGAVCMLALRLPDDAALLRRFPWLERVVAAVSFAVALFFVVRFLQSRPMPPLRRLWPSICGASFLFFAITFGIRYVRASGHRRDILRALAFAMVPPLIALGLVMAAEPLVGASAQVGALAYPALSLAPIAVAFAFVRYDLWGSRVLLSRILTRLVVGGFACIVAIAVGAALATELGVPFHFAVLAATAAGVMAAVLVVLALHAAEVYVFPARAHYKPSIEQLSADLINITSPDEVARAIERTVHRWLPCEHIRLVPTPAEPRPVLPGVPATADDERTGEIPAHADPGSSDLSLPVVFGGERLGVLEVGAKPGGALFTSEDLDLLHTVVNQGALALAHARAYQELEERRKQQAAAWRGEREALIQTVAAEISHEIRYPLNFFRSLFGRAGGKPLSADDLDVGREEVERLERLVGELRRMTAHQIKRRPTALRDLCSHAEMLLRDACAGRPLDLSGDPDLAIRCDPDQATQILVNLLANALQACGERGHVGVAWSHDGSGARIVVWDDGPGFVGDAAMLFAPWYTTKERGTGLGLAITHRLVRAHGWSIAAGRDGDRTVFTVTVPSTDVVPAEDHGACESITEVS